MDFDPLSFVYREDTWMCMIRQSHSLFCDCPSWIQHLKRALDLQHTGWRDTQEDGDGADKEDGGQKELTDGELIAALEEVEGGEEGRKDNRSDF